MPKTLGAFQPRRRTRRQVFHCSCLWMICVLGIGCQGSQGDSSSQTASSSATPFDGLAYESCVLTVVGEADPEVLATLVPQGVEWSGGTEGRDDWSPSVITAVAVLGDSLAILDGMQSRVTLFDAQLKELATFGRSGEGPGEFRRAIALAATPERTLAILDIGTKRLTVLDAKFQLAAVRQLPTQSLTEAMAFHGSDIYLSQSVFPFMVSRNATLADAVSLVAAGSDSATAVVRLMPGTPAGDSVLRLPGPNTLRVVVHQGHLLMLAPAAGIVDVLHGKERVARLRTCMPPALDIALSKQQAANDPTSRSGSQQSLNLVSDAMVLGDTVFLVGPLPDAEGRLHVDRYRLDGSPIGSVVVPLGDIRMPEPAEIRFWGSADQLVAFSADGVIMRIKLKARR